jgi:hypothetical protein
VLSGVLWTEVDLEDIPAHRSAEEILAHPRFPLARQAYVKAIHATYEHNPLLSRLLLETGRTVVFIGIMCLHARHERADRASWPTLGLVTEQMVAHGVGSPRRVRDLVRRLIMTGYLEQRGAPQDRRTRILTPTAKMIAHDQDFLVSHHLPLQTLFPEPGYRPIMRRDPAFQLMQRRVSAGLFARGARMMAGHPVLMPFLGRDAGAMILLKLMQMVGSMGRPKPLELSFSDFGARVGVSRTHVRNLLKEAEAQGLVRLTRGATSQFVEVRPALVQAFDRFVAESMAGHDLVYNLTLARLVGRTPTGKNEESGRERPDAAHRPQSHRASELSGDPTQAIGI